MLQIFPLNIFHHQVPSRSIPYCSNNWVITWLHVCIIYLSNWMQSIYRNTKYGFQTHTVWSLLGDKKDIQWRKQPANSTLNKLPNICKRIDCVKRNQSRLRLNNFFVNSVLLFTYATWLIVKTGKQYWHILMKTVEMNARYTLPNLTLIQKIHGNYTINICFQDLS